MNTSAIGFKGWLSPRQQSWPKFWFKAMLGIFSRFLNLAPEGPEPGTPCVFRACSGLAQGLLRAAHPRLRLKRRLLRSKDGNGP